MSEVIIDNVKFKNVPDKRYGTKIGDLLTQSNVGMSQTVADYIQSDDFYALVNGVDIDWNGIEVEDGLVLDTTADLINWIIGIINKIPLVKIISVIFSTEASFPTSEEIQRLLGMSAQDFARYGSKYQYYFYLKKEQKYYFIPAAYNKDNTNVISIRGIDDIAVLSFHQDYSNGVLSFSEKQAPDLSNYYTKEDVNTLLGGKIDTTLKGAKNGVASLDSTGKVPASQLPSYVDDVLEGYLDDIPFVETFSELNRYYAGSIMLYLGTVYRFKVDHAPGIFTPGEVQKIEQFPHIGEVGKIYLDVITSKTYRWSGSAYTQIKGDLVIGTTHGTAFDGAAGAALQTQVSGISTQVADKVDKVTGKGLSTNDYTNEDKDKVAAALTQHQDISGKADVAALNAEVQRAQTAEGNLQQLYENLSQSQTVPVTALPATGEAGKIYRLAGVNSYADYMYNESDLTTPIKMAEYDNAIDDEPTVGSDNLVKSGGVANIYGSYTESPEYVYVQTDNKDKILYGVKQNGEFFFGAGCPQQVKDYIENKIADFSLDEHEDIIAFLNDYLGGDATLKSIIDNLANTKVDKVEGKSLIDAEYASTKSTIGSSEFIEVKTDSAGKVLAGRTNDGVAFENIGFATPEISIDGHTIENFKDPEGRSEITTDAEGRILSYRDSNGVKYEEVGIETNSASINHLNLTEIGMTEFQLALKDAGMRNGGHDFSNAEIVELPEPKHYGILNLIVNELPLGDAISEGYAEYYDFAGNYFKKACEITIQGQTSKYFPSTGGKGNYTLDITDGSEIKFGSWVPQDSFHLKGSAKDVTRGYLSTSYKLAFKVMEYLNARPNRVLMNENNITTTSATGERITDWSTDARCLPDGFPCELYVNGEYWGLYSLQLKKDRKNYSMDKKDYTSFFIDADAIMTDDYQHGIWNEGLADWWTKFEIKNPKNLYCMDGSKYDGDNPKELIDSTSPYYDSTNSKHVGSATTKSIIESFSTKYLAVKELIDNSELAKAKELFANYFDVDACIFVYIFNSVMYNADSVMKNTLWGTYSNGKIVPMLWDLDFMYGQGWVGDTVAPPSVDVWNTYANAQWPLRLLWSLYETEIRATYTQLRSAGVISMDTWRNIVYDKWVNRIGTEAYERDIKKWPETPSYRKNYINSDYWLQLGWQGSLNGIPLWNEEDNYSQNDIVAIKAHPDVPYYMRYKAKQANRNQCPVTKFYECFPQVGGCYNSPKRMEKWMEEQIALCDTLIGYTD